MAQRRSGRRSKTAGTETADITHVSDRRSNNPSAEDAPTMTDAEREPSRYYVDRNPDLDPQLVWRGKATEELEVAAPPIFIQERIRPKALIEDLRQYSATHPTANRGGASGNGSEDAESQAALFADFNGLPSPEARTEFYQHDANWSNRLILGDSLQVMASLTEKEGLKGQVQCIYLDPPYGINFRSNWQWSTKTPNVRESAKDLTREPEQIKAFRDTWGDGINSYLTYLRDRFKVARDLLSDSGSIFVQIGDANVHRVRDVLDEVFGDANFVALITFIKSTAQTSRLLSSPSDYLLWYAKSAPDAKYHPLYHEKKLGEQGAGGYTFTQDEADAIRRLTADQRSDPASIPDSLRVLSLASLRGTRAATPTDWQRFDHEGRTFDPRGRWCWKTSEEGMHRLAKAGRLAHQGNQLSYKRFFDDFVAYPMIANWADTSGAHNKRYVVETQTKVIQRCILMTTDPGDLVLDPTCGGGTTAFVAEQWGRRWITIDTSRVALAITRARIMGARYPYYLLSDSAAGVAEEARLSGAAPKIGGGYSDLEDDSGASNDAGAAYRHDVRQGFVYERVPHITLASIANNTAIDDIWQRYQDDLEPLLARLNRSCGTSFAEWEVPRDPDARWSDKARELHATWWRLRIARQREVDACIASSADYEYLYDQPRQDAGKVRVAGPFTVESVSPHRMLAVDDDDEVVEVRDDVEGDYVATILENLKASGVRQLDRRDRLTFASVDAWPGGGLIAAEAHYTVGDSDSAGDALRAAVHVGPEFATVTRQDIVEAARDAAENGFEMLICCGFQYDAQTTELERLGRVQILQARMNADLHMASELKPDQRANLFVVFGEPDIDLLPVEAEDDEDEDRLQVRINGVDVYDPSTGAVRSDDTDGIAMWFIDTDYNSESFFVRQAYFLGDDDPYQSLKRTLKSEINVEAWETLNSDVSRPFGKPSTGRIAVKVINNLGDEVMKVFRVD